MTDAGTPNRYAIALDDLVDAVRVPVADQTTGQPTAVPAPEPDEQQRQLRLAGGA